jgi:hypothetical protein
MRNGMILEGELVIWDQEGGYVDPSAEIGGTSVTRTMEDLFEEYRDKHSSNTKVPGQWRLTLEEVTERE